MDGTIIKYIDYDLDLRVFPDGGYRVLDKNEYKYHKKLMRYSDDIDFVVKKELSSLIEMKQKNEGPFNKKLIFAYNDMYNEINNA
jgi:protein associated with RNAse G/E